MTDLKQAAQAALAELDDWAETFDDDKAYEIAAALRAALAQPEKAEPVLYWHKPKTDDQEFIEPEAVNGHCPDCVPLYLHPPAERRPMTVEKIIEIGNEIHRAMPDDAEPEPKVEPHPKLFTLSDRLRPGVECAAWVIDDVRRLESAHAHQYSMAGQMLREAERAGRERDEAVAALRLIAETDAVDAALDPQRAVRVAHAALAQPEPQHYPLPDELYAASKDWRTANYAGRVEWLRTMYESKKREADSAFAMLAAQTPKAERRPMAGEEAADLIDRWRLTSASCINLIRAVERHHGIGGSDE